MSTANLSALILMVNDYLIFFHVPRHNQPVEISRLYLLNLSNPNAVKPADETAVTVHGFSPHRGRSSPAPAR